MGERLPRDIDCVCKDREVEFIRWVWETVGHARLELRALGGAGLCHGKSIGFRAKASPILACGRGPLLALFIILFNSFTHFLSGKLSIFQSMLRAMYR